MELKSLFLITLVIAGSGVERIMGKLPTGSNKLILENSTTPSVSSTGNNSRVSGGKHRQKRFLYLNIDGSLDVGFLLTIPFTIVLPPMSNLFNAWRYRRRRSDPISDEEENDPILQHSVNRIQSYFELIQIPELPCQTRAMCEFASESEKYFPLADLILKEIREPTLEAYYAETVLPLYNDSQQNSSLFGAFTKAVETGLSQGQTRCQTLFRYACPFSTEQRLNLPLLQFWKVLGSLLDIKFHVDFNY